MEVLSAMLGLVPDAVKGLSKVANRECQIKLAPEIHPSIPEVMNGGNMQQFANLQVCFGSDTNLELIDAVLFCEKKKISCEERDIKLYGGRDWNNFSFSASELIYVPDEIFTFKIRVYDHMGHCCELSSGMQMKQFPHPDYTGIKSGRWVIHPKGIFKVKCSRKKRF